MNSYFKTAKRSFRIAIVIALGYTLFTLFTPFSKKLTQRSIENQISYLDGYFTSGLDSLLQSRYPEGSVFSNAIFALSVIEYGGSDTNLDTAYTRIVDERIDHLLSQSSLTTFNEDMTPKYGIFYNAWVGYTLLSYKSSSLFYKSTRKDKVNSALEEITRRIENAQRGNIRTLDSYPGSNWPADNLVSLLALEKDSLRDAWLDEVLKNTQHPSGLINHAGNDLRKIRGSSQALISFCLNEMGYEHNEIYNDSFKELFVREYLNVQFVKEHEDGSNTMDVDSGPIYLGFGASATIMNIKTQASYDNPLAKSTWAFMNLISFPVNLLGKKYYLFKKEPMFDIFMLWASVEL